MIHLSEVIQKKLSFILIFLISTIWIVVAVIQPYNDYLPQPIYLSLDHHPAYRKSGGIVQACRKRKPQITRSLLFRWNLGKPARFHNAFHMFSLAFNFNILFFSKDVQRLCWGSHEVYGQMREIASASDDRMKYWITNKIGHPVAKQWPERLSLSLSLSPSPGV